MSDIDRVWELMETVRFACLQHGPEAGYARGL